MKERSEVSLVCHRAKHDLDYWQLREFLRDLFRINGRREISWQVARFDYFYCHILPNCAEQKLDENAFYWSEEQGDIKALLVREVKICYLNTDPEFRQEGFLKEMLATAEKELTFKNDDGKSKVAVEVSDDDSLMISLLQEHGFQKTDFYTASRKRILNSPVPEPVLPPGFKIRNMLGREDHAARSLASWDAFHHNDDAQFHGDLDWYAVVEKIPMYRAQLDIVATTNDNRLIGFCTVSYDDVNRTAYFEPVGLIYDYHRKGLGRAMMLEGLRRAENLGCEIAFVSNNTDDAGELYEACGFELDKLSHVWVKVLD